MRFAFKSSGCLLRLFNLVGIHVKIFHSHGSKVNRHGKVIDGHVRHLEEVLHDMMVLSQEILHLLDKSIGVFFSFAELVPQTLYLILNHLVALIRIKVIALLVFLHGSFNKALVTLLAVKVFTQLLKNQVFLLHDLLIEQEDFVFKLFYAEEAALRAIKDDLGNVRVCTLDELRVLLLLDLEQAGENFFIRLCRQVVVGLDVHLFFHDCLDFGTQVALGSARH